MMETTDKKSTESLPDSVQGKEKKTVEKNSDNKDEKKDPHAEGSCCGGCGG